MADDRIRVYSPKFLRLLSIIRFTYHFELEDVPNAAQVIANETLVLSRVRRDQLLQRD